MYSSVTFNISIMGNLLHSFQIYHKQKLYTHKAVTADSPSPSPWFSVASMLCPSLHISFTHLMEIDVCGICPLSALIPLSWDSRLIILWLTNIPLCTYATLCLSAHLVMDIRAVPSFSAPKSEVARNSCRLGSVGVLLPSRTRVFCPSVGVGIFSSQYK